MMLLLAQTTTASPTAAIAQGLPALVQDIGTWGQAGLIAALLVGLVLWLLGRKIARPAVAISGLVIGGLVAAMTLQEMGKPSWMLAGLVAGGIICCLVAWLLFRVWMGLTCAVMLALVAPAAALVWQGQAPDVSEMEHAPLTMETPAEPGNEAVREALWQKAQEVYQHEKEQVLAVWQNMSSSGRTTVAVAAAAGALGGLLAGLILPYTAATLQSALVGSILIFSCGLTLAHRWMGDVMAKLPAYSVRAPLIVIGLITIVGVGIQWTLSRRRADR